MHSTRTTGGARKLPATTTRSATTKPAPPARKVTAPAQPTTTTRALAATRTTMTAATTRAATKDPKAPPKPTAPPVHNGNLADKNAATTRMFKEKRDVLSCPACSTTGAYVLNGLSAAGVINVKCTACGSRRSGKPLATMLATIALPTEIDEDDVNIQLLGDGGAEVTRDSVSPEIPAPASGEAGDEKEMEDTTNTNGKLQAEVKELRELLRARDEEIVILKKSMDKMREKDEGLPANERMPTPPVSLAKPTPENPTKRPKSWAEVARHPVLNEVSDVVKTKLDAAQKALAAAGFTARPRTTATESGPATTKQKPRLVAAYFGGIPRGPLGKLRQALRLSFPSWAIQNLSFVGNVALEVLCHEPLKQRLIAGMKLLGFRHLEKFVPGELKGSDASSPHLKRIRSACYRRWKLIESKTNNSNVAAFYAERTADLEKVDPTLTMEGVTDNGPTDTNVPDKSGGASTVSATKSSDDIPFGARTKAQSSNPEPSHSGVPGLERQGETASSKPAPDGLSAAPEANEDVSPAGHRQ